MHHTLARVSLALGLGCALLGSPASAGEAEPPSDAAAGVAGETSRIVLVIGPELEELTARFMAELAAMHFDVVPVDASVAPPVDELEQVAWRQAAQLAVRIRRTGNALDLCVVKPRSGEVVYRRVVADGDPAVVVLRSLEILRGALIELQAISPERRSAPAVVELDASTPPAKTQQTTTTQPLWLGGFATIFAARLGRDLGWGASLGLYRHVGARFAVHGELLLALSEWSIDGRGGEAKVRTGAATVGALVVPWGEGTITPGLGLGVGALALHTRGVARSGYSGTTELNVAAFPHTRLELAAALSSPGAAKATLLTDSIRLRASLVAGFATPRPVLVFAGETAQASLNPLWYSSLGVEVALR